MRVCRGSLKLCSKLFSKKSSIVNVRLRWTMGILFCGSGFESSCSHYFAPASSKEFLDIQATMECGFTLKRVSDMIRTYRLLIKPV